MIIYLNYIRDFKFYISLILILSLISVFFLNDFLFDIMYFPDQPEYFRYIRQWRSLDFENFLSFIFTDKRQVVKIATLLYSFIPLPTPTNLYGFAFFNKFLIIIIIFVIMKKNIISGFPLLFIILYPSLHLYSSLTLRDTLVLFLMFFTIYSAFEKNFFTLILFMSTLYLIKVQNFYLLLLILTSIYILNFKFIKKHVVIFLITSSTLFLYIFGESLLEYINHHSYVFYVAEVASALAEANPGGAAKMAAAMVKANPTELTVGVDARFIHLDGYFDLIYGLISGAINFYFAPIISVNLNSFELIQSLENIFVSIFLIYFVKQNLILDKYKTFYWILLIFGCFAIYGSIAINPGTIARWRFPFIIIFIIGLSLDNKINKQKLNE